MSIDRNRILIGDVGEDRREAVDAKPLREARGANFGWPIVERTLRFRHGHIRHPAKPIFQYPHKGGNCDTWSSWTAAGCHGSIRVDARDRRGPGRGWRRVGWEPQEYGEWR